MPGQTHGRSYWPTHEQTDGWNYMCNSILPNHTWVTWKKELYFSYVLCGLLIICKNTLRVEQDLVRDSSAVRQLFVRLAGAVRRQSALHKGNSGFAAATLRRHISTFRGYQILFSIRNPYINRFTNHFSIRS
jgi:hypothetical protein